jgi:hypothetical protein
MRHSGLRGSDLHSPTNELVENNTGSTILGLKCVTFSSYGTLYPQITVASGGSDVIRGIVQSDIATSKTGYITSLGIMSGINTNAWNPGTKLYCSPSGDLTTLLVGLPVGIVLKKDIANGAMYVDNTGITQNDLAALSFPPEAELQMMWSALYPRSYSEFSYNGTGDIVDFNVWSDDTKTIAIFNKHFTYLINGDLNQIVTTNLLTSLTKTRTLTYNINGELISMKDV